MIPQLKHKLSSLKEKNFNAWDSNTEIQPLLANYAKGVDSIIIELWRNYNIEGPCLIAVGGYGRSDLAPYSDIDLLILLPDEFKSTIKEQISVFISSLWDIGLEAGQSVRTISECIDLAKKDSSVSTNLLDARFLVGEKDLFSLLKKRRQESIDSLSYSTSKLLELKKRHARFQDTPYSLEPNIKESPGGLRDVQTIKWICAQYKYASTSSAISQSELLTPEETKQLNSHEKNLKKIRSYLHVIARRGEDRLIFDLQTMVAKRLGYRDNDVRRASEQLMQTYFNSAKVIFQILEMFLANIELRLSNPKNKKLLEPEMNPWVHKICDGFYEFKGLIDYKSEGEVSNPAESILDCFRVFQSTSSATGFSPRTTRFIWSKRTEISDHFANNIKTREFFVNVFKTEKKVSETLILMHKLGVLGRIIPSFRQIIGQMQHDLFHIYTVDQHTLQVIKNLERFTKIEHTHEFPLCSELITLIQPWTLYLSAFFHDIAKGRGGDHSILGEDEVKKFGKQFNLHPADTELVCFLVREHLLLSAITQKEDIDDPSTIEKLANRLKNREKLTNLYLLTVADIRGTSPKVWNNWKAKLLMSLFYRTNSYMLNKDKGKKELANHLESEKDRKLQIILGKAGEELKKFMNLSYFLRHEKEDILWHSELLHDNYESKRYIISLKTAQDKTGLKILVYGQDRKDLFCDILAYFYGQNLNVLDAKLDITTHGYALDSFLIDQTHLLSDDITRLKILLETELTNLLNQRTTTKTEKNLIKVSRRQKNFPLTPKIEIVPDEKQEFHILSVTSSDVPGLLYNIVKTLGKHEVSVHTAKVSTLGEKVEDVFLIYGKGLQSEQGAIDIETDLRNSITV